MKKYYLLLVGAIVCEVFATTMLKASNGLTEPLFVVLVVIGYLACFTFLTLSLKGLPLGAAYGIWSGVGVAVVCIIGVLVWHDPFNVEIVIGIIFVILGVVLLETSTKAPEKDDSSAKAGE